ncbi:MAG: hypothetical protein CR997_13355 [Acidobacteria bacterium]|nr:MAG: hypothetical protein CR997_13355 [Acidobacteriota bacterium]
MSIEKLGKQQFKVELNRSNTDYISKIVMNVLLEHFEEKCIAGELLHYRQIEKRLAACLPKAVDPIHNRILAACESALNQVPNQTNRKNLFGRALIEKIIVYPETKTKWLNWFKKNYLNPFLQEVRISMGAQNFDYFNDLLDMALQNECMIHDLEKAHLDWSAFFLHTRVNLMLTKARKLRQWLCNANNQDVFLESINKKSKKGIRPFSSKDLWHILDAWEYDSEE